MSRKKSPKTKDPVERAILAVHRQNALEAEQTSDHSTQKVRRPKKQTAIPVIVIDEIHDLDTGKRRPITNTYIPRLAQQYIQWAGQDDALILRDFISLHKLNKDRFYAWMEEFPELKEAHDYAKRMVGSRRERGALTKLLEKDTVLKSMAHYAQEWKDLEQWRAGLRVAIEDAKRSAEINVIMQKFVADDQEVE